MLGQGAKTAVGLIFKINSPGILAGGLRGGGRELRSVVGDIGHIRLARLDHASAKASLGIAIGGRINAA